MTQSFIQNNIQVLNYNQQIHLEFKKLCKLLLDNLGAKRFAHCVFLLDNRGICRNYKMLDHYTEYLSTFLFRFESAEHGYRNTEFIKIIRAIPLDSFSHYIYPIKSTCPYIAMAQEKFKLITGIVTFKRNLNHIEVWCLTFGDDTPLPMILTDDFRIYFLRFIKHFNSKTERFLTNAPLAELHSPIDLSYIPCSIPDFQKLQNLSQDYSFIIKDKEVAFTNRQWECMLQLSKGKSYKEIGGLLDISSRTVEHHVNVIKEKLGCNYKSEILDIFHNNLFHS